MIPTQDRRTNGGVAYSRHDVPRPYPYPKHCCLQMSFFFGMVGGSVSLSVSFETYHEVGVRIPIIVVCRDVFLLWNGWFTARFGGDGRLYARGSLPHCQFGLF